MKLTYDPRYNIAYIRFHEKVAEVETIRLSEELAVDMAPDGTVYGIELLNANELLNRQEPAELVVANEATGESAKLPLSGGANALNRRCFVARRRAGSDHRAV